MPLVRGLLSQGERFVGEGGWWAFEGELALLCEGVDFRRGRRRCVDRVLGAPGVGCGGGIVACVVGGRCVFGERWWRWEE